MNIKRKIELALVALAVVGCSSTVTVDIAPSLDASLCRPDAPAELWWTTRWRADQKDMALRDAAAQQGIESFFSRPGCFASTVVHRGTPVELGAPPSGVRIVLVVRELGPTLRIGSSVALVDGATEVAFDVEVTGEAPNPPNVGVRWRHGGPGTVKGVASLPSDMATALAAVFRAPAQR